MRKIVANFIEDSRSHHDKLEIFCPDCTKEELQYLVDFLYDGEIRCENSEESVKIFKILTEIFGFPNDLHSKCQSGSALTTPERQNEANLVVLNSSDEDLLEAVTLEVTLDQNLAEVVVQNPDEVKSDDNEIDLNGSKVDQNTTEENVDPKDLNPEGNNLMIEYLKTSVQQI